MDITDKPNFNPYQTNSPATGNLFVGRNELANEIIANHRSIIVFGYSRMGKSSFLKRLCEDAQKYGDEGIYIPVSGNSMEGLKAKLAAGIKHLSSDTAEVLSEVLSKADTLENGLYEIDRACQKSETRWLIALDETAELLSDVSAIDHMKGLNQNLANVTLAYAIFPHIFEEIQAKASRFQDSAQMTPLLPFTYEQTETLVRLCEDEQKMIEIAAPRKLERFFNVTSYTVDSEAIDKVFSYTGGFPFLIQELMQKSIQGLPNGSLEDSLHIFPESIDNGLQAVYQNIREQMAHMWNAFSELQKTMIEITLTSVEGSTEQELIECTRNLHEDNPSLYLGAINPLAEKGNGILLNQNGRYSVNGEIFRKQFEYFVKNFPG